MSNQIVLRLFIGCLLTADLRLALEQSISWKQEKISPSGGAEMAEVSYQGKAYVGCFFKEEAVSLSDLKQQEISIRKKIALCCPEYRFELLKVAVFSQAFIT